MRFIKYLFVSIVFLYGCNNTGKEDQKKVLNRSEIWVSKKIGNFYVQVPSDFKIEYMNGGSAGTLSNNSLQINWVKGYSPVSIKSEPGEMVIILDTTTTIFRKVLKGVMNGEPTLVLQVWNTSITSAVGDVLPDHGFESFHMHAPNLTKAQEDTVLKIYNSLKMVEKK